MLIRQVTSRADGDRFGKDFGGATHRPSGPHFFPATTEGVDFLNWWRAFILRCATWRAAVCVPVADKLIEKKNCARFVDSVRVPFSPRYL